MFNFKAFFGKCPCADLTILKKSAEALTKSNTGLLQQTQSLNADKIRLTDSVTACMTEKGALQLQHDALQKENALMVADRVRLINDKDAALQKIALIEGDIATYQKMLQKFIPPFQVEEGIIEPSAFIPLTVGPHIASLNYEILDPEFLIPTWEDSKKILDWIETSVKSYIVSFRDCDNFAFYVSAMASMHFGVNHILVFWDIDAGHLYNIVLVPEGNPMVFEPIKEMLPAIGNTWELGKYTDYWHILRNGKIFGF